jgi:hypothetical protein
MYFAILKIGTLSKFILHKGHCMSLACRTSEHKRARIEAETCAVAWTAAEITAASSLAATLKMVVLNDAALCVLAKDATLAEIAGWARVSHAFNTIVFGSDKLWFKLMMRVWTTNYNWSSYKVDVPPPKFGPIALHEKKLIVPIFRPCVHVNWKFMHRARRARSHTLVEAYTLEQLCRHESFHDFLDWLDLQQHATMLKAARGKQFKLLYRAVFESTTVSSELACDTGLYRNVSQSPAVISTIIDHLVIMCPAMYRYRLQASLWHGDGVLHIYFKCFVA